MARDADADQRFQQRLDTDEIPRLARLLGRRFAIERSPTRGERVERIAFRIKWQARLELLARGRTVTNRVPIHRLGAAHRMAQTASTWAHKTSHHRERRIVQF